MTANGGHAEWMKAKQGEGDSRAEGCSQLNIERQRDSADRRDVGKSHQAIIGKE